MNATTRVPRAASGSGGGRKKLASIAKVVFALGILALVLWNMPWRDQLVWKGDGAEQTFAGTIRGKWTQEQISFELDPSEQARAERSPKLAQSLGGTREVRVTRGSDFDWRPGMPRVFGGLNAGGLALALGSLFVGILFTTTRWWRLLKVAGCPTTWYTSLRLTLLGFFFNLVVPGLTGGDVVKAVLAAREHPSRRAGAVVSVFVDRIIGLFALAVMGSVVILLLGDAFAEIRVPVLLCLGAGLAGVVVYSSRTLRRVVRFDSVLAKLPMSGALKQIDEAALIYSRHPLELVFATLFSLANHVSVVIAIFALGRAFGEQVLSFAQYLALISVGNIVSALPVAPGGWGVGEAVYAFLFNMLGASPTLGVAVSVTFRLCLMLIGLFGGIFMLLPGTRSELEEIETLQTQE